MLESIYSYFSLLYACAMTLFYIFLLFISVVWLNFHVSGYISCLVTYTCIKNILYNYFSVIYFSCLVTYACARVYYISNFLLFQLFGNLCMCQGILSDPTLQQLSLACLLSRYLVLSLSMSPINADSIYKCQKVSHCIKQ